MDDGTPVKEVRYLDYPQDINEASSSSSRAASVPADEKGDGAAQRRRRFPLFGKKKKEKKDEGEEKAPPVGLLQLFRFADKIDSALLGIGAVAACASGVAMPLMTIIFSELTGTFLAFNFADELSDEQRDLLDSETRRYCWYFFALGLGTWVVAGLQKLLWGIAAERMGKRVRETFYEAILRQDVGWFDGLSTGELTTRISGDVNVVQEGIGEKFSFVMQYTTTFVVGIILAFTKGWRLTLVVLSVLPLMAGSAALMGILLAENTSGGQDAYAEAGSVADEVLSSIKTVMAFGGQDRELARFGKKIEKARAAGLRKAWVLGGCMGFIMFAVYGVYALGFWYGGKLVREGRMIPEDVLNAFFALIIGGFSLGNAAPSISAVASARGAATKVYQVIDRQSPIDAVDSDEGLSAEAIRGDIELADVDFRYPTRPDVQVLQGLNIRVEAGQRVALVGESGCGKSTMISLLERFYDPEQGTVRIDGVDVKEYNVRSLRQQIGVIMQMPVLFGQTIYQNILWGAVDPEDNPPTRAEVEQACRDANAHDFISALPDGYDTLCGERGALLSGGQKQRIAIARALIRNPKILLLDEATSALDSSAERVVQDALDRAARNRTTVTVAHRLSTIKDADVIYVIAGGRVLESGGHEDLVAKGGAYSRLVEAQNLRQALEQAQKSESESDRGSSVGEEKGIAVVDARQPSIQRAGTRLTEDYGPLDAEDPDEEEKDPELARVRKAEQDKVLQRRGLSALPQLVRMNSQYTWAFIPGTFLTIIDGASLPCFSLVFSRMLVAMAIPDHDDQKHEVNLYGGLFFMFAWVAFFAVGGRTLFFARAGEKITFHIRHDVFRAMMRQDAVFFDRRENGTGALTARLATEAADVNKTVGEALPAIVAGLASIITGVAIAFSKDWRLTLVILATLPLLTLAFYLEGKSVYESTKAMKNAYEKASQEASETVANIRTVTTLTREHTFIRQFKSNSAGPYRKAIKNHFIGSIGYGFAQSTMFLVYCLAFFVGSRFILDGLLTTETMFAVMYAIVFAAMSLGMMAQQTAVLTKGLVASEKLLRTLESMPEIDARAPGGLKAESVSGDVELSQVRFTYPTRPRAPILRGVSLAARPGQTVALVGASGSGKSTIVSLVQRLYDCVSGHVSVEGTDVREWNVESLRSNLALVGQEPVLFDYSIGENIAYGKPDATQQEIEAVARQANIHGFVAELPDGYATPIGETGGRLSGGQRQRIAIARALIRSPRILLLDEASSALDSQSEKLVQQALDSAAQGRTTITIAHRLSTIQNADLILVFRAGRIVEQGSHDQLLAAKGLYSLLARPEHPQEECDEYDLDLQIDSDLEELMNECVEMEDASALVRVRSSGSMDTREPTPSSTTSSSPPSQLPSSQRSQPKQSGSQQSAARTKRRAITDRPRFKLARGPSASLLPPQPQPVAHEEEGKDAGDDGQLWWQRYEPQDASSLAVHAAKIAQVRGWLEMAAGASEGGRFFRILVVEGPAGVGKSTCVRVLAQELDLDVIEWINPLSGQQSLAGQDDEPESVVRQFEEFLRQAQRYAGLDLSAGGNAGGQQRGRNGSLILVDDLPNIAHRGTRDSFRSALQRFAALPAAASFPMVIVVTESYTSQLVAQDGGDERRGRWRMRESDTGNSEMSVWSATDVIPSAIYDSSFCQSIRFNLVAPTIVTKGLRRILQIRAGLEGVKGVKPTAECTQALKQLADECQGDLRLAVTMLQVSQAGVVQQDNPDPRSGDKRRRKGPSKVLELPGAVRERGEARRSALALFHALGKVLYAKREMPREGKGRGELESDPNDILDRIPVDLGTFGLYIHENHPDLCAGIDEASEAAECLSWADEVSSGRGGGRAADVYGAVLAVRGFMHAKGHPDLMPADGEGDAVSQPSSASGSWKLAKFRKPEYFECYRRTRANGRMLHDERGAEMLRLDGLQPDRPNMVLDVLPYWAQITAARGCSSMHRSPSIYRQMLDLAVPGAESAVLQRLAMASLSSGPANPQPADERQKLVLSDDDIEDFSD
ncbi:hypothetical protein GGF46_003504 [Coemansia sp. RSA 552]|nr:hypothetical protein GGF46_003504 [Coemansia sp. RSA 552]